MQSQASALGHWPQMAYYTTEGSIMESRPGTGSLVSQLQAPLPPAPSSHMPPRIALASLLGQAANSHRSTALLTQPCPFVLLPEPAAFSPRRSVCTAERQGSILRRGVGGFNSKSLPSCMTLDTGHHDVCPVYTQEVIVKFKWDV